MRTEQFDCLFDSVLTDVVKQTYCSLSLPSSEQIQLSIKKMMDIIETNNEWQSDNGNAIV